MKTIESKKRIKKERGSVTTQNKKAERKGKNGKICNQKGAFGSGR